MNDKIIQLDPSTPLPCSIFHPTRGICGNDAYAAYAYAVQPSPPIIPPGQWVIQPVCAECAAKAAAVYGKNQF